MARAMISTAMLDHPKAPNERKKTSAPGRRAMSRFPYSPTAYSDMDG
jgi:hypothetical protein